MDNHNTRYQFQPRLSVSHSGTSLLDERETMELSTPPQELSSRMLPQLSPEKEPARQFILPPSMPGMPQRVSLPLAVPIRPGLRDDKKKRRVIMSATFASVLLLATIAIVVWRTAQSGAEITLYQVSAQNATSYVGGGGIVFPQQKLDLSYPFAERVIDVLVKAGDEISLNQTLLRLDPTQLNAQVQQAADNMAAAQAYLDTVSASGNSINIAQAQQQYNLAKNKYNALVAQTSLPLVHDGNLISPMNGVVTSVNIDPGEVFTADTPLLTIMDESTVIVRVKVPLANLGQVSIGQDALVTPSALPNLNFHGTVSSIIPQADPQTDTFEVWVSVANPKKALLPGMSAFVRIHTSNQGFVVPRLAVLDPDMGAEVFVVRNQHAYLQHVEVVGRSGDTILINKGLSPGDKLALVGIDVLRDGQAVSVRSTEG